MRMRTVGGTGVHVIDEDRVNLGILKRQLQIAGHSGRSYDDPRAFLLLAPTLVRGCVLASLRMDRMDGLELLRETRALFCKLPVVFMAEHRDAETIVAAMKHGAFDVLLRPIDQQRLERTVANAVAGQRAADTQSIAQHTDNTARRAAALEGKRAPQRAMRDAGADAVSHAYEARSSDAATRIAALPPRCRDVLEGVAEGLSAKIIANRLGISPRTVENHKVNMLHRLGARHTADAIRMAVEAGLLDKCA